MAASYHDKVLLGWGACLVLAGLLLSFGPLTIPDVFVRTGILVLGIALMGWGGASMLPPRRPPDAAPVRA